MKSFTRLSKSTIFRYVIAGGSASLVDVILFNLLIYMSGTYYLLAVVISSTISFFIRFFLQRKAFGASSRADAHRQLLFYGILFVISVGLTAFLMYIFVHFATIDKSIAQIISILLVAIVCFFVYKIIIFPNTEKNKTDKAKRLLVITQKIDKDDPVLGFFHAWVEEFAKKFESVIVICLEKGRSELPENVKVLSLGKEERQSKLQYLIHFYWYILNEKKNYDAVFVHMNQQYVVLGAFIWKLFDKSIYMWRNHVSGSITTKIAVRLCDKVFCTSEFSYTARYKKTFIMPVGIDTGLFKRKLEIEKIPRSILFLGRMAPIKKPDLLCKALIHLDKRGVIFKASFYGSPILHDVNYYEALQKKVNEEGLSEKVFFHTEIRNYQTLDVYNAHEISVNLSPSGLYDKTIFEGMACETIILASSKSLYGIVREDSIFKEDDVSDLAHKLEKLLNLTEKEKIEKGKELREIVTEDHSLEKLMIKLSYHIK